MTYDFDSTEPPMSLEAARRVIWPFDSRESMGMMFDNRTLTRSKLQWAVEKAVWSDVRRAAQTLIEELERQSVLVTALPKPAPSTPEALQPADSNPFASPRYGPRVVVASDYLEDQETLHWLLRGQALWLTSLSIVGNVAVWIWFIGVIHRQIEKVRTFRAGRKDEEHVVEQLRTTLDDHWTIYRNLQLPDRRDDLDL